MSFSAWLTAVTLLATVPYTMHDGVPKGRPSIDDPARTTAAGANTPEPGATLVTVGDPAPNFSYFGLDGRAGRLRDLLAQGPVLLVFGVGDANLLDLQRERDVLFGMGVVPVAIADRRAGATRTASQRLGLTYPIIPDPRAIAAAQFNALDPSTLHPMPAWFVVDRNGRVRALGRGSMPQRPWADLAASALGMPAPGSPRPVGKTR